MRRDHRDALFCEVSAQGIAIVGFIADEVFWFSDAGAALNQGLHEGDFVRAGACDVDGDRQAMAIGDGHDLCPFAGFGLADAGSPLFRRGKGAIDKALVQIELAQAFSVTDKGAEQTPQGVVADPLLKAAMASLVGRIL